ncbi:MAG: hypothetical protein V7L22_02110 [Nostoc sp.]
MSFFIILLGGSEKSGSGKVKILTRAGTARSPLPSSLPTQKF